MGLNPTKLSTVCSRLLPRKVSGYCRLLFFLTACISSFFLSGTAAPGLDLDESWQTVLEYASVHKLQFGTEILFTYGPLNYLNLPFSQGSLLPQRTIFATIWSLIAASSATMVTMRLKGPSRLCFAVWFLVFSVTGELEQHVPMVVACGAALLLNIRTNMKLAAACWLVMLSILSLVKFNFFIASVITVTVVVCVHMLRRKQLTSVSILAGYGGCFLLFWLLCGQRLTSLPAWFRGSLEITAGYSEAMSLPPETALLVSCAILMVLLIAACGLIIRSGNCNLTTSSGLLLLTIYAFLSWKHGVVRAGGEMTQNFVISVPLLFGLLLAIPGANRERKTSKVLTALYILTISLAVLAAEQIETGVTRRKIIAWPERLTGNLKQISHALSGDWQDNYEALQPAFKRQQEPDLPLARSLINNASVDVLNCLQWSAFANRLNYRPRPVIQSYSAYTPYLQQVNLHFFRSGDRPDFLLFNPESIDGRLAALDDAAALPFIFSNYRPVGKEGDFAILQAKANLPTEPQLTDVTDVITRFDQPVDLSPWSSSPLVMKVEMSETVAGRIRKLLYQPPAILIRLHTGNRILTRRFVPSMGRVGFIVNPAISTTDDVISLYRGNWQAVTGVEFVRLNPDAWGYANKITLKIERLDLP